MSAGVLAGPLLEILVEGAYLIQRSIAAAREGDEVKSLENLDKGIAMVKKAVAEAETAMPEVRKRVLDEINKMFDPGDVDAPAPDDVKDPDTI